jgi:hypothetical protein
MKKLTIITILCIASINVFAQKNSVLVMGSIEYFHSKSQTSTNTSKQFSFNPMIGYQFNENLTIGGFAEYSNNGTINEINMGPFVRYTSKLTDLFSLFADAKIGYVSASNDNNGYSAGIKPAAMIQIGKSFALNFSFGELSYKSVGKDSKTNTINANFGKSVEIGISKNFGLR